MFYSRLRPAPDAPPRPVAPGRVTAIEPLQRRRDRVNVYIDDQFAFPLALEVQQAAMLRVGDVLDAARIASLQEQDRFQAAVQKACTFLTYRPRSEKEVRQSLVRRFPDPDLVERVVARLKELRFVDDESFARFWVENRAAFRPRGERALLHELGAKGVDVAVGRAAIDENADEAEGAYRVGLTKLRALASLDDRTFRVRMSAFLARRGFDYEVVSATVDRLRAERAAASGVLPEDDEPEA